MAIKTSLDIKLDISGVKGKTKAVVGDALHKFVVNSAGDAVTGSPKDTGHNAQNIFPEFDKSSLKGNIHTESSYGGFLEVGTVKMSAQPYIMPAAQKNVSKLQSDLKGSI